jgi:hypothetical protein
VAGRVPCGDVGWVEEANFGCAFGWVEAALEAGFEAGLVDAAGEGFVTFASVRVSTSMTFPGVASVGLGVVACWRARRFTLGLSVTGAAKSNSPGAASGSGLVEGRLLSDMTYSEINLYEGNSRHKPILRKDFATILLRKFSKYFDDSLQESSIQRSPIKDSLATRTFISHPMQFGG